MASRPVRGRVLAHIQLPGGWPAVLEGIANGETGTKIARSFNVSRCFFARPLHEDRARHEVVCQAGKVAADALHESAVYPTRDELQGPNLPADLRVRLAPRFDREQYRTLASCTSRP